MTEGQLQLVKNEIKDFEIPEQGSFIIT